MLIIDGHNLIPCVPGLSLEDLDDEMALVKMLQVYARVKRKQIIVFFDGAPLGHAGSRSYGAIKAHFVSAEQTADDAIRRYLEDHKAEARSATVVSNDRMVRANAVALRALVESSDHFARELFSAVTAAGVAETRAIPSTMKPAKKAPSAPAKPAPAAKKKPEPGSSAGADHLEEWYEMFHIDPEQAEKPIAPTYTPPSRPRKGKRR